MANKKMAMASISEGVRFQLCFGAFGVCLDGLATGDELVTFECRSTCLYLLELGLEQAEMERSASWMRQLKDSELRQGVKKEVQFHRRRCVSILAGGFLDWDMSAMSINVFE